MNIPRQPFVGLALMAGLGIVAGDFFPVPEFQWPIWAAGVVALALALLWKPQIALTYALVALGFFLLHNFRTRDTIGLRLAAELTERPRVVNAVGFNNSRALGQFRSEEHTSELQSRVDLVCRLLLEKKKTPMCETTRRQAAYA